MQPPTCFEIQWVTPSAVGTTGWERSLEIPDSGKLAMIAYAEMVMAMPNSITFVMKWRSAIAESERIDGFWLNFSLLWMDTSFLNHKIRDFKMSNSEKKQQIQMFMFVLFGLPPTKKRSSILPTWWTIDFPFQMALVNLIIFGSEYFQNDFCSARNFALVRT